MKAYARSVRIAPKKASLIAKMIRGMSVPDAVLALERTDKKAARIIASLLRSAMANASHNDRQDPQILVVRSIVVNKAQAYHRGVPMARGRMRPMRKFLSHLTLTLGVADEPIEQEDVKTAEKPSQEPKKPVQRGKKTPKTAASKTSSKRARTSSSSPSA